MTGLLRVFRRLVRIPAILFWAVGHGFYAFFFQSWRRDRVVRMARQTRVWGAGLLRIFGIRLRIHGECAPGSGAKLVVSNHTGYFDVFSHAAAFGLRFAPKKEIRSWPLLGWYTQLTDPVWVDRSSPRKAADTLREFRETLRMGASLIVYPEGTSSDGWSGLKPFKSTSFETVAGTDIPIQPVLIFYRAEDPRDCSPAWYGDMTFLPHLWKMLGNGKCVCDLFLLPLYHAPADADRKQIMNEVRSRMEAEYLRLSERMKKEETPL